MLDATPLLHLYARYRLSRLEALDAATVQEQQLLKLVAQAKDTRFGLDHGFGRIRSVPDYQNAVPLRRYEDFWTQYWEKQLSGFGRRDLARPHPLFREHLRDDNRGHKTHSGLGRDGEGKPPGCS